MRQGQGRATVSRSPSNNDHLQVIQGLERWPNSAMSRPVEAQVIDLFSGCGGMSLGFAAHGGFDLVGAVDINASSLRTYERNLNAPTFDCDVRELAYTEGALEDFLAALPNFRADSPTVLIGCAPCQGFSAHSKKRWGQAPDERNSLVLALAHVAAKLRPEVVVMENVPELLSGRYWKHFEGFQDLLGSNGYRVKAAIHNAAEYGVPQERFRAVVVGVREYDFTMPEPWLKRSKFATVRTAIGDLPPVASGETIDADPMHRSASHRPSTIEVIRAVPADGGNRPAGVGPKCLDEVKGFYDVYGRLSWDKPAITITHYARNPASGRFVHPVQDRGLTMREAARLQGFPDGFEFEGTFDDVFRQIGEAVPPPMAAAIASSVYSCLRDEVVPHLPEELIEEPVKDSFAGVIAGLKRLEA